MSDHFSGPAVMGDPAVDITDFYAFPSPERPGNLVLIMNVFPMATSQSFFSDVLTHRFRLRPLTWSGGSVTYGTAEHTIDVTFSDVAEGSSVQTASIVTSDGREASFVTGKALAKNGMRVFAGLVSDPFFMDVEATLRTDISGKLSFDTAANTVQFRDVLSIVVEVPFAPLVERFDGATLIGAIAETMVTRRGKPHPARTSRAAGDQERPHGEPDSRPAHEGHRTPRSLQSRRRLCALPGISTPLRVASRCKPDGLRCAGRQDGLAARTRGAPSVTRVC